MNNLDSCIVHLIKHYRDEILVLRRIIKWNFDDVNTEYILGKIDAYLKVIEDLNSLF